MPTHEKTPANQSLRIGDYVSIHLRGSSWYANYSEDGRQRRISLKTSSKKQARLSASKIETRLLSGTKEARKDVPAQELVQEYIDYIKGGSLARKTKQKYLRVLDAVLHSLGGSGELDYAFVDRFRKQRLQQVSESTTYDECMIILQATKFGERRQLLTRNPLAGYNIIEPKPKSQPCWTRDEGESIVENVTNPLYRAAFQTLLDTGMRSGELTHLQWSDVDIQQNVFHIREKTWKENGEEQHWRPKTGDQRAVPITRNVKSMLEKLSRRNDWVFLAPVSRKYPLGDHRITETRLLKALKPVLKKLSLPGKVHTFRHTFISVALTSGVPEATVRMWVGHVDAAIIRRYTHIADQISQQQMSLLTQKLESPSPVLR